MAITPISYPQAVQPSLPAQFQAGQQAALTEQQIRAAQLQEQTARAQLPGVEADAAVKARAARFNQWLTDNAPKFSRPDPARPGQVMLDAPAFTKAASLAGYHPEAQSIAIKDFELEQKNATVSGDKLKLVDTVKTHVANLVTSLPSTAQKQVEWNKYREFLTQRGEQELASMMGDYSPEKEKALLESTLTPKEREEREKIYAQEDYVPGKPNGDPTTPQAKLAQEKYIQANPGMDPALVRQLGIPGLRKLPDGEASITAAREALTLTAPERLKAEATVNELIAAQSGLNTGAAAAKRLTSNKTFIGQKLSDIFEKYALTNPDVKVLQDKVQQYEQVTGRKIDTSVTLSGVERLLKGKAADLTPQIKSARKGTAARISAEPLSAEPEASVPAAPATGTGMPMIRTRAEWDKLPSGAQFIGPDGKTRSKP